MFKTIILSHKALEDLKMKGMDYTRVARVKILKLHLRADFIGIKDSSDNDVTLMFKSDECTVDKFGKVLWVRD